MALSRVISDTFNVKKYCNLENPFKGQSVIEGRTIQQIGYDFILVFYSNFVLKTHYFRDI